MSQPQLLEKVLTVLNNSDIDYMVTGSIVSSLQGEPRATHDVDIVVNIQPPSIAELINVFLPPRFYLSEESIREAIIHRTMFNLIDTTEGDKIDFWMLTNEPFDRSRFERKYEEDIFGFPMKISTAEDTILSKLKWVKLSGGSEKQFTDALRVYELQYTNLDFNY
ncbi:MAG TPA: hypothetical protein VGI61_00895, partial [Parafilimonas sp.]